MATTILLVDDNKEILAGLHSVLDRTSDMEIIGDAHDGIQAVRLVRELKPDVVVMDITMPRMNGIDATRKIVSDNHDAKIVALSVNSEWGYIANMIEAGAKGYLLKDNVLEELRKAIAVVAEGGLYISKKIKDVSGISIRQRLSRMQKSKGKTRDKK